MHYLVVAKVEDHPDAFVLSDYDFYYTDDNKCPFEPDDLVYVIDGHN